MLLPGDRSLRYTHHKDSQVSLHHRHATSDTAVDTQKSGTREIKVVRRVLDVNDAIAARNRENLARHRVYTLNMMSSPGSGKTTTLECSLGLLSADLACAVIVGDICTTRDADRLAVSGVPVVQVNTDEFGGDCHLAAHVIAIRIVSVSFLPGHGIGEAACVLTGQAVGAGDVASAHRVARRATVIGLWVMGVCGVAFLLFGATIFGVFKPAPDVLEVGVSLLMVAAAFQLFDAVAMIKTGALNGTGDTTYVMAVSVGTSWAILVPLGYVLCETYGLGAPGAWIAITAQVAVMSVVFWRRWEGLSPVRRAVRRAELAAAGR